MAELSKTRIDKLGAALKAGEVTELNLRALDEYRNSFSGSYELVVGATNRELNLSPTGRPAKSTSSIIEKLRRETIRLTQIQDIAGCRIIVADIKEQDAVVSALASLFKEVIVVDRRSNPSHGYRAVHLIVKCEGLPVEIQVRTALQHLWAELSEKLSDQINPALKYGGGDLAFLQVLNASSHLVAAQEELEGEIDETKDRLLRNRQEGADESKVRETIEKLDRLESEVRSQHGNTLHVIRYVTTLLTGKEG